MREPFKSQSFEPVSTSASTRTGAAPPLGLENLRRRRGRSIIENVLHEVWNGGIEIKTLMLGNTRSRSINQARRHVSSCFSALGNDALVLERCLVLCVLGIFFKGHSGISRCQEALPGRRWAHQGLYPVAMARSCLRPQILSYLVTLASKACSSSPKARWKYISIQEL